MSLFNSDPAEINIGLMRKTLEWITDNPNLWDQVTVYNRNECGTTACFAGWALVFDGKVEIIGDKVIDHYIGLAHTAAAESLGLDIDNMTKIFGCFTTNPAILWQMCSEITNGEIEIPPGMVAA